MLDMALGTDRNAVRFDMLNFVLINYLSSNYYKPDDLIRFVDIGRSYEKMMHLVYARYLNIGSENNLWTPLRRLRQDSKWPVFDSVSLPKRKIKNILISRHNRRRISFRRACK